MVFGLPPLERVCVEFLDGLATVKRSCVRHKNSVVRVQRTNSSRVMIVDRLIILLTNYFMQLRRFFFIWASEGG